MRCRAFIYAWARVEVAGSVMIPGNIRLSVRAARYAVGLIKVTGAVATPDIYPLEFAVSVEFA